MIRRTTVADAIHADRIAAAAGRRCAHCGEPVYAPGADYCCQPCARDARQGAGR